jgi:RES domain-containing protein
VDFEDLPDDYVSVEIDIPDTIGLLVQNDDIDIHNITETQDYGDNWLSTAHDAGLSVPSAVVPKERNVCLNPAHDDFKVVQIVEIEPPTSPNISSGRLKSKLTSGF